MGKIQALNTVEEGEFQTCDTSLLSGMDAFAFGYEVEWPVSLVLNHKAMAQYLHDDVKGYKPTDRTSASARGRCWWR
jgi:hypothetical protein